MTGPPRQPPRNPPLSPSGGTWAFRRAPASGARGVASTPSRPAATGRSAGALGRPTGAPALRLVGGDGALPEAAPTRTSAQAHGNAHARARAEIARENLLARSSAQDDPRLLLAAEAAAMLEGGRAAILRPERRAQVLTAAKRLGVRAFEANLAIAVAQDLARQGRSIDVSGGAGRVVIGADSAARRDAGPGADAPGVLAAAAPDARSLLRLARSGRAAGGEGAAGGRGSEVESDAGLRERADADADADARAAIVARLIVAAGLAVLLAGAMAAWLSAG